MTVAVTVLLLAHGACQDDRPVAAAPTPTEPAPTAASRPALPAPAPLPELQDEHGRALFVGPEADWVLARGEAALEVRPDAVLTITDGARCRGLVAIRPAAGARTLQAGEAVKARELAAGATLNWENPVLYQALTARRMEVSLPGKVSRRVTVFVVKDQLFEIVAHATDEISTNRRSCMDAVTGAFSLLIPPE